MGSERRGGGAIHRRANTTQGPRRRAFPRPKPVKAKPPARRYLEAALRAGQGAREAIGRALHDGGRRLWAALLALRAPASAMLADILALRGARRQQNAAVAVTAAAATFVVLMAGAMALYPGGTWMNRQSRGYDLVRNFFCDLSAAVALNGAPNPGAPLASAAMVALALGLLPFWLLIALRLRALPRRSAAVRALGLASAAALPLVPCLPSARCGSLHVVAVLLASLPGIAAAVAAASGLWALPEARRPHGYLAGATLFAAGVTAALYLRLVLARGSSVPHWSLPAMQKLAAAALLAWLVVTAETTRSSPSPRLLVTARRRRGRSRRRPRTPSGP